ncbi:OmpA family protein [Pendulispora albinea]|uniref:OmpA family protein n=1 Tax=Pendulispora albinea TaxID=2741071 RepID=A0ABZ2LYS8_9BACT
MMRAIPTLLSAVVLATACAGTEKTARAPEPPSTTIITSAPAPTAPSSKLQSVSPGVAVSDEIAQTCRLAFADIEQAPKFDFDSDELAPSDRDALQRIGKCLTTGPLAGHEIQLVGRADPRGTEQYNMALGARRADTVATYLKALGVGANRLHETSRGELDSTGTDEVTWAKDRRVDVLLAP